MRRFRLPAILVGLVVGLVGFLAAPEGCLACSCVTPSDPLVARERSAAVFAGRVSAVEERRTAEGYGYFLVTFQVGTVWKGSVARETIVGTGLGGGVCGYRFVVGRDYLVYARDVGTGAPPAALTTTDCSRTAPLEQAGADLAALGPGAPPANTPLPTLPNTGEGFPPPLTAPATPSLIALLFLSAVLLGVGTVGRRKGQPD